MLTMNDAQWSIMLISDCSFIWSWHLRFPISVLVSPLQFRPEDNRFGKKRRRCNWGRKNTRNNWHLSIFIIRGWHGKYTSQDQWCVLSSVVHAVCVCVIYCMYQIYKIAPRHSQTWQNSIGFAALLGLLQTQSNECQSICQLLFGSRKKSHYFMLCQLHWWEGSKSEMKTNSSIGFQHHSGCGYQGRHVFVAIAVCWMSETWTFRWRFLQFLQNGGPSFASSTLPATIIAEWGICKHPPPQENY